MRREGMAWWHGMIWTFAVICSVQFFEVSGLTNAPGWCSMYGECGYNPTLDNSKARGPVPCKNNVAAAEYSKDSLFYERLKQTCPELVPDGSETILSCCSSSQLQTLALSVQASSLLFNRCPSCVENFKNLFCQNTCSPDQSTFINVTRFIGNQTLEYRAFWDKDSMDKLFQSCKDVIFPQTNGLAVELMCNGYSGSDCTVERWLAYTGSLNNGVTPVGIEHVLYNNNSVPSEPPAPYEAHSCHYFACSESPKNGTPPCSCTDCEAVCPPPPPLEATEPPFFIGDMDGVAVIVIIVFCSAAAAFMAYVCVCYFVMKNKPQKIDFMAPADKGDEDEYPRITEDDVSCFESLGKRSQDFIEKGFRLWGKLVARHPIIVILVVAVIIGVLCIGIPRIELTTDPIQLWSAEGSQVRQEKDFYDENFGAFYRTEQVIMKLRPDLENATHSYTSYNGQRYKFSAILEKERLLEMLKIQNEIRYLKADFPEGLDSLGRDYVTLKDICFKPLEPDNNNCTMMSLLNYWQNSPEQLDKVAYYYDNGKGINYTVDYHDHFLYCVQSPNTVQDTTELKQDCMGDYGGPVLPYVALGGYTEKDYHTSIAAILTFTVRNFPRDSIEFRMALAWEKEYLKIIEAWNNTNFTYAYFSERSIEDEIVRQSQSDLIIFLGSYIAIFLYITIALGTYTSFRRIPVDSKVTLGFAGIIVILASVFASIGLFGFIGLSTSLIVVEVVPFLVLAIGADNVFILTLEFQRDKRKPDEDLETQVGRVLGEVAPSMLLCSLTEGVVFFLGALSDMPAVQEFAYCAAVAILFDFLLQVTVFVAVLTLDVKRQEANRSDLLCCIKIKGESHTPTRLDDFFRNYYIPALMLDIVRALVLLAFFALFCWCVYLASNITVGLDQDLSVPLDSYVLDYFNYMESYLAVGVPLYFVTKGPYNFSNPDSGKLICGSAGCDLYSLTQQISYASENPDYWEIATPATSWYDDYVDWLTPFLGSSCCRYEVGNETNFCPATDKESRCRTCIPGGEPTPDEFMQYIHWFLKDNPGIECNKGGHASYGNALSFGDNEQGQEVILGSYFFAYHTVCIKSVDCTNNLRMARKLAENITKTLQAAPDVPDGFEVYPYCLYYVYYEQYLTMIPDTLIQLGLCLIPTFIFNFILLGFDLYSGIVTILTILMIVVDTAGICSLWGVDLNAVSLINLVTAIGLSVEFISHVVRAFSMSTSIGRKKRVVDAMTTMGPAVFAGVTLTNLPGIIVLAFAKSQLIQIFFFRMCFTITMLGMAHGLMFLPVFLSYFGPPVNKAILLEKQRQKDSEKSPYQNEKSVENKAFEMEHAFETKTTSDNTKENLGTAL